MSEDAKAILLLHGHLGGMSGLAPLHLRDYNAVVQWLAARGQRPADLLSGETVAAVARDTAIPESRLSGLLKRGASLGFAMERWNQSGIWVVCRSDSGYPSRYRSHLKEKAPPVLFGVGDRSLLQGGGLAIVGSRDMDAESEAFAREVAAWCARGATPVVSGGARGVDHAAMESALDSGGAVIGVVADNLFRRSVRPEARQALADGRLLLITPYDPEARFAVGNAMGRNKLIYALADYGLVVCTADGKGGTWQGAIEELKHRAGRPVFVRADSSVPTGNRKLLEHGAIPFPGTDNGVTPAEWLEHAVSDETSTDDGSMLPLFRETALADGKAEYVKGRPPESTAQMADTHGSVAPPYQTVYEAVLPVIIAALDEPTPPAELANRLDVSKAQLDVWLKRAVGEGKVREMTRPIRYVRAGSPVQPEGPRD